jgi:hypothetical protein
MVASFGGRDRTLKGAAARLTRAAASVRSSGAISSKSIASRERGRLETKGDAAGDGAAEDWPNIRQGCWNRSTQTSRIALSQSMRIE